MGILRARQNLFQTKCDETTPLPTHIATLKRYREDLSDLQKPVADDDFALIILGSLPNSWKPFIEAFLGSHMGKKISNSSWGLIKVLFDEEKQHKLWSNLEVILVLQNWKGSQSYQNNWNNQSQLRIICWNCGKARHMHKDCWSKEEGRRDKVLPNLRIPNPLTTILNQVYLKLCRLWMTKIYLI